MTLAIGREGQDVRCRHDPSFWTCAVVPR
jgi:hypothetical protein